MKTTISIIISQLLTFFTCFSQASGNIEILINNKLKIQEYDSALYYSEEMAAMIRANLGENNLEFADALRALTVSNFYIGNFAKARYYSIKEIELRESLKATKDIKYINAIENTSIISNRTGLYQDALVLIRKAEKIAIKLFNEDSPEYAKILSITASVYNDMGNSNNDRVLIKKGEEYFKKAEKFYDQNNERFLPSKMHVKSNYASYLNNLGNSPGSENQFLELVDLCEKTYGSANVNYASSLNNLAVLYYNLGNYMKAEKYFIESVNIFSNSSAKNSIEAAICINNYGALFHDLGNYSLAIDYLNESKTIFDYNKMTQHQNYSILLNNLAIVEISEQYYADPENKSQKKLDLSGKLFMRADSIFDNNCKMPHPNGLTIKLNYCLWIKMNGDSKKALKIVTELAMLSGMSAFNPMSIINKMAVSDALYFIDNTHGQIVEPVMIPIKTKIADHFVNEEQLEINSQTQMASTKFLIRALFGKRTKIKEALGPYHPAYAELLKNLIPLYRSIGDYNLEEMMTLEVINVFNHNILQDFSFLSDSEKEIYYKIREPEVNSFISYSLERKEKNPNITGHTYNFILQNKGLMLKSSTAMRLAILNSKNSELLSKYDEWIALQKEISALYSIPVEMRSKDINILEQEAGKIEKYLVQSSQIFGDFKKELQTTWIDIRDSLKTNEAAVEFTQFKIKDKEKGFITTYCALLLRSDSKYPEMVRLFEEGELKALLGNSSNNFNSVNELYGTKNNANEKLYQLIWQPIEKYLDGISNIYLSPSGLLHKISFASISNGKNVYLCDKYQIQIKSSTGNNVLTRIFTAENEKPSTLVFGGIQYGDSTDTQGWTYLKGTKDETDALKSLFEKENIKVDYLTEYKATETYLKQNIKDYNILHIATHGFFFPDPSTMNSTETTDLGTIVFRGEARSMGLSSFANSSNPLMRSGLVFAGANKIWDQSEKSKDDDGVLTALELTQVDMRNCDLVVLSACETGLGDIKGSEGVFGLQRAFKMAGSKYIIMSLWQVPDKETEEFMINFYTKLLELKDIKQAFIQTQKEMRAKYDPYYWAAFILVE